jgi:hypothetical protein
MVDPHAAGIVRELLDMLSAESRDVEADLVARMRVVVANLDALRKASSEDEFEATYDLIARPRFTAELFSVISHPGFRELDRKARAQQLAGRVAPINRIALEHAEDLLEKFSTLMRSHGSKAKDRCEEARAFVAFFALNVAAYDRRAWHPWMVGMLWNFGHRALLTMAKKTGIDEEAAVGLLTTSRDRKLLAKPFDQEESDRALRLLGLV